MSRRTRETSAGVQVPEQRILLQAKDFIDAGIRAQRDGTSLEMMISELRASMVGPEVSAIARLFRGYAE